MKKTVLTTLCLALGASFAFAQTNVTKAHTLGQQPCAISMDKTMPAASYKGSIFAKEGEMMNITFSAEQETAGTFTTGVIQTATVISGDTAVRHTQTLYHAQWHRWADTTNATLEAIAMQGSYPATVGTAETWGTENAGWSSLFGFNSTTPMDGLMVMTMQDQIAQWGGSGQAGNFDAYIAFSPIDVSSAPLVDVNLYQFYRKFNADKCYVDYSSDGTNWQAVEFNVRGIDVNTNSSIMGTVPVTLPTNAISSTLNLRIRWTCSSMGGGAYGYFWLLDDVTVTAGENSRIRATDYSYYEGVYPIMPAGLQLPIVWYATLRNNGVVAQNDVKGTAYAFDDLSGAAAQELGTTQVAATLTSDPTKDTTLVMDPMGIFNEGWWITLNGVPGTGVGSTAYLPTNLGAGAHGYFYGNVSTTALPTTYANGRTCDTVSYIVSEPSTDENILEARVWGRDNGVLRREANYRHGLVQEGGSAYLSTNADETNWNKAGYMVFTSFNTPQNIPEGWVIRGVQIVASTSDGLATAGAKLIPYLTRDSMNATGTFFMEDISGSTGAGITTVTSENLFSAEDREALTYETFGNYPVINLMFPNQPPLEALHNYNVGYELVENAAFCVATGTHYYINLAGDQAIDFDTVPGMEPYGYNYAMTSPSAYNVRVLDPNIGWAGFGTSSGHSIPMIRMLVGPRVEMPTFTLSAVCGDNGEILDGSYNSICGQQVEVVKGATNVYYAQGTSDEYSVDSVFLDGAWIDPDAEENADMLQIMEDEQTHAFYAVITISDIQANHELRVTFKKDNVGIDPVAAKVRMTLQPNPATSNVQLSIEGVSGMVNYSLIDMSGRTISAARINAENAKTIDVSNLAKGAYFVRITNDKMSKVEKLIVR